VESHSPDETAATMASKNAYSNQQVDRYLEHINVPQRFRRGAKLDVELLTAIQQHHLCRIPFDDIQIHYSTDRSILLEPEAIFNKFVEKGHGGYCMEHNALIYYMLLALGFEVYTTGARPQKRVDGLPSGNYYGW
jgi:arylamine N-acetyltransferase